MLGLVALVMLAAVAVVPAAPADAQENIVQFRFDGGGFGHGTGMSQYGAKGQADAGRNVGTILTHYYRGTAVAGTAMPPQIRVGLLQGTPRMTVRSAGGLFGSDGSLVFAWNSGNRLVVPGQTWEVRAVGGGWQLYLNGGPNTDVFFGGLQLQFGARNSLVSIPETGHTYRWGTMDFVHRADPTFDAVVAIGSFDAYLYGLGEVPSSWHMEALRAQAIAGRTYALDKARRLGEYRPGCSCTVFATTVDQNYIGYDKESGASGNRWVQAVQSTASVAVLSGGLPIQAFYSSSSGGHTENNEFVFNGSPLSYLRGVPDPWDATPSNPNYRWSVTFSQAQISGLLDAAGLGVGSVTSVQPIAPFGVSGRVGRVLNNSQGGAVVNGTAGVRRLSGDQLRSALRLKSTLFGVSVTRTYPLTMGNGIWFLRNTNSSGAGEIGYQYGDRGDIPIVGDWDGDGIDTPGIVRGNWWFLRNSNTSGVGEIGFQYGDVGDIPVVGDWDGNGTDTPGIMRGNYWFLRNANTSGPGEIGFQYGDNGDIPIVGDWNADGADTAGIVRGNYWFLRNANTSGPGEIGYQYGDVTDVAIVGDWNGDGTDTPGIARGNARYLRNSNTSGVGEIGLLYGDSTDVPIVGDWNNDGVDTPGIAR